MCSIAPGRLVVISHLGIQRVEQRIQNLEPGLAGTSRPAVLSAESPGNGQTNEHGGILDSLKYSWKLNEGKDYKIKTTQC